MTATNIKKSVRISTNPPSTFLFDQVTECEKKTYWLQKKELEEIKESIKNTCLGLRKSHRFSGCLTEAYKHACSLTPNSFQNENGDIDMNTTKISVHCEGPNGMQNEEFPRGLEPICSRFHGRRRLQHREEIKMAVLVEQVKQKNSRKRDAESLARTAAQASKKARSFGTFMGQVDAWLVHSHRDDKKWKKMKVQLHSPVGQSRN